MVGHIIIIIVIKLINILEAWLTNNEILHYVTLGNCLNYTVFRLSCKSTYMIFYINIRKFI